MPKSAPQQANEDRLHGHLVDDEFRYLFFFFGFFSKEIKDVFRSPSAWLKANWDAEKMGVRKFWSRRRSCEPGGLEFRAPQAR